MLKIFYSVKDIYFSQLMQVYSESNDIQSAKEYPNLSENERMIHIEQDFYLYLTDFFKEKDSFCAVWMVDNRYIAALRAEPYSDGVLLEGLECDPAHRRRGYSAALVSAVLSYLKEQGYKIVYSHVNRDNCASLELHRKCGFCIAKELAHFIDGTVSYNAYTLCYNNKTQT